MIQIGHTCRIHSTYWLISHFAWIICVCMCMKYNTTLCSNFVNHFVVIVHVSVSSSSPDLTSKWKHNGTGREVNWLLLISKGKIGLTQNILAPLFPIVQSHVTTTNGICMHTNLLIFFHHDIVHEIQDDKNLNIWCNLCSANESIFAFVVYI